MTPVKAKYAPEGKDVEVIIVGLSPTGVAFGYNVADGKPIVQDWEKLNFTPEIAPAGFAPEPPPKPSEGDVWQEIIDRLHAESPGSPKERSVRDALITLSTARRAEGIAKYGTPLQRGNGRNHWIDAMQEALDLAVYLQAAAPGCSEVRQAMTIANACAVLGGVLPGRSS